MSAGECQLCGGWGWITVTEDDEVGATTYQVECPEGCEPEPPLVVGEVPF